jgi:hypothetical protein
MHCAPDFASRLQFLNDWIRHQHEMDWPHDAGALDDEKPRKAHFSERRV